MRYGIVQGYSWPRTRCGVGHSALQFAPDSQRIAKNRDAPVAQWRGPPRRGTSHAKRVARSLFFCCSSPCVARESSRDDLDGGSGELGRRYTAELPRLIARAVSEASARLAPTRVSFGREIEPRLAFNRRYWMKDGTVGWNPGKLNPNTVR